MIYLDYSATTKTDPLVLDSFNKASLNFIGNPNSHHLLGLKAKELIDASTKQIIDLLNINEKEVIYTSGASEANNAAIKGICLKYQNRGKHIITTKLEHSSIIAPLNYLQKQGFKISFVELDEYGRVDLENLKKLLTDDTVLVSIASVNSEVGVEQDLEAISKIIRTNTKTFFHSDMTQSVGKVKVALDCVDLASASAQKFYGIKGIGMLLKNKNIVIEPLIHGGKSTTIYRSGTPPLPLIVSISKALRLSLEDLDNKYNIVLELNTYLKSKLKDIKGIHINSNEYCIPHILNISVKGIKPETILHALEEKDIYISTQTACSNDKNTTSMAVLAITKNEEYAKHSIRISISYKTTKEELDILVKELKQIIEKLGDRIENN